MASSLRVVRAPPGLIWRALDGADVVGGVSAMLRPDGRWYVHFGECREDSYGPLLAAVAQNTGSDLHATADEADPQAAERLAGLGFAEIRRESILLIPTDPQVTGLAAIDEPDDVVIISAIDAWEDELRALDDALRQDVPGTDGWKWDPGDFHDETFDSQFNPATYLVAVDKASGDYLGLVRIWDLPGRPRLGLIAVLRPYRRRGLAKALLARALRVLHERGTAEISAEADDTNSAAGSLLTGLGARRAGGIVEFVRPA